MVNMNTLCKVCEEGQVKYIREYCEQNYRGIIISFYTHCNECNECGTYYLINFERLKEGRQEVNRILGVPDNLDPLDYFTARSVIKDGNFRY